MTHRRPEHFRISQLKRIYNRQTDTFTINISYETAPATLTERTKEVAEAFGLGIDQTRQFTLYDNVNIHIKPTDIVLITGDSGSGKSALLKAIKQDLGTEAQDTKDTPIDPNKPIIETVGTNTTDAIEALSQVGLNDAFLFLRPYQQLSDGQKHRYQTALLTQSQKPFGSLTNSQAPLTATQQKSSPSTSKSKRENRAKPLSPQPLTKTYCAILRQTCISTSAMAKKSPYAIIPKPKHHYAHSPNK